MEIPRLKPERLKRGKPCAAESGNDGEVQFEVQSSWLLGFDRQFWLRLGRNYSYYAEYSGLRLLLWWRTRLMDEQVAIVTQSGVQRANDGLSSRNTFVYKGNPSSSSGPVKHIDTMCHHIQEFYEQKIVQLVHCPTAQIAANALMALLGPSLLRKLVERVGLLA